MCRASPRAGRASSRRRPSGESRPSPSRRSWSTLPLASPRWPRSSLSRGGCQIPHHAGAGGSGVARRRQTKGARNLRRVLNGDEPVSLSRLESRFHALLRDNRLPLPLTNTRVGSHRVDCRWERPPLTVELDGYRYHRSRHAWEQDRRREREARARGDDFRRYTWRDVFEHPGQMLAELRAVISPPW